jgi:uncharacterized protein YjbI with pentapeptide repeats
MANPEQLDKLLRGPEAWACWRAAHLEVEPDLSGAQLAGANLGNSDLVSADLSEANLRRAKLANCNLAGAILAGADLTGAELPRSESEQLDHLDNLKQISSNAQKLFIVMLAACLYSWLTIATTTDVNLVTNHATSSLPVIQTSIPIVGFFYVAPVLLLGTYFYFHFYLQKLWDELGLLPAIFPDGKPLHSKTDPWLLSDLVRLHAPKLKDRTPFLSNLQIWISVVLAWWVVPLTLLLFWARYLVRHEFVGTIFQSVVGAVAISSAFFLYRLARNTLRGVKRTAFLRPSMASRLTWIAPVCTGMIVAALLIMLAIGAIRGVRSGSVEDNYWLDQTGPRVWIPEAMTFFRLSPFADLRAAELSTKSANWTADNDKANRTVKGIQLSGTDLRFADMRASFLSESFLTDTNLGEADLWGVDLNHAGMVGANLQGAGLANSDLRGAFLLGANLKDADIKYAHFEGAQGLTAEQLRSAENWCEAYFDPGQLQMLGLPEINNEQVAKWQKFDETNSALSSPTTLEAAREAELRRFSATPAIEAESTTSQPRGTGTPSKIKVGQPETTRAGVSEPSPHSVLEFAKIYDFPLGLDGSGQTIGVIELGGGYRDSDLDQYFQKLGLRRPHVFSVSVDGHMNSPTNSVGADSQVEADIEVAGAVAPGAQIVVYFSGPDREGFQHGIQAAVQDTAHHPSVISIGWGSPEGASSWERGEVEKINEALHQAADRNITVVAASGDNGARDARTENRLRVDFPASSPWVLSVGGTTLIASGNSVISETVWNDGLGDATGGGVSEIFDQPEWQTMLPVPHGLTARPGRGVPDVAINASPDSGYQVLIDGSLGVVGGTSMSAPMWAGLIALLNQGLGRNLGFFNPLLYEKLGKAGTFRSILVGNNGTSEMSGYCAGPGWNAATGWGTPDGTKMLQALKSLKK